MITDNTCKGCGKEKCDARKRGGEMHDQCPEYPWACCGHPEEKKPQPKVCERCGKERCKLSYSHGHGEHSTNLNGKIINVGNCSKNCHGSCPPLPPKDCKGEEGWELEFDDKFSGSVKIKSYEAPRELVDADRKDIKAFIHQVAAQAREDDYSKAIEDAMEAVKLYCPKQQNHSAFEKGFDSCKRIVLSVLDKLKKK